MSRYGRWLTVMFACCLMSKIATCQEVRIPLADDAPMRSSAVGNGFPLPFGFAPKSTVESLSLNPDSNIGDTIQPANDAQRPYAPVVDAPGIVAPVANSESLPHITIPDENVAPVSHDQVLELQASELNQLPSLPTDTGRTPIVARGSASKEPAASRSQTSKSLATTFSGLCIVLGLLMGFVWFAKRSGAMRVGSQHAPLVEVLASYRIGPRNEVSVVRFGSKLLALSVSASGTETLAELNDPQEVAYLTDLCGSTNSASVPWRLRQAIDNLAAESHSPRSTYHS